MLTSFSIFSNLILAWCSFNFYILIMIRFFLTILLQPSYPDLRPPACAEIFMQSLLHPFHIFCIIPHKHEITFYFSSIRATNDFSFLLQSYVFAMHSSYLSQNSSNLFPYTFFPSAIPPTHTFETFSTFPHVRIEIPQRNDDFTRTSLAPLTRHFIIKTNYLCVWSSALLPILSLKLAQLPSLGRFFYNFHNVCRSFLFHQHSNPSISCIIF